MTTQEFSPEFDLLYNNISSNQAPGLTEYEKSIFLTQAQEEIALGLYEGKYGESFEGTEEMRTYLNPLILNKVYDEIVNNECALPEDYWYMVYESALISDPSFNCKDSDGHTTNYKEVYVYPVTLDTLYKTKESPFRGPNSRRILRVYTSDFNVSDSTTSLSNKTVHLYSKYPIVEYRIKYLRKPVPIILEDLPEGLTIDGETKKTECELSEALHRIILRKAVELAKQVWVK